MIVDPHKTPMKKHAPINPILDLDSQSISAWFCQLSMQKQSSVSALYSPLSLLNPFSQINSLLQLLKFPVYWSKQQKCLGSPFINGKPKMINPDELSAAYVTKMINIQKMEPPNVWPFESSLSSNMMVSLSASSQVNTGAQAFSGFYNKGSLSYGAPLFISAINQIFVIIDKIIIGILGKHNF